MATIAVQPLVLKDVLLTIGTDNYEAAASSVVFTPSSSPTTWAGLNGETHTDTSLATWTCDLTYVQDWETANSLSQYLLTNEGDSVSVTFKPKSGSGPSFTATVSITPGAVGGTVNSFAETSVSLGSTKPTLVPAAP